MRGDLCLAAFALAAAAATATACGGVDTGGGGSGGAAGGAPCAEHPLECAAGRTCWFSSSGKLTCQPSGAGEKGDVCAPLEDEPTCGDGMLCFKPSGAEMGTCAVLCDPSSGPACDGEELCALVQTPDGEQTRVCKQ